jgi:hypothetical protein
MIRGGLGCWEGLELGVFMHERCWSMRPASEVRLWLLHRISLVE